MGLIRGKRASGSADGGDGGAAHHVPPHSDAESPPVVGTSSDSGGGETGPRQSRRVPMPGVAIRKALRWRQSRRRHLPALVDDIEHETERLSGAVAIIDGARLTVVRIAKNRVVFFSEDEHDTPADALRSALRATRRTGRVVWAGDVAVRELAAPPDDLHPRMVPIDQAERLARGFDALRLSAAAHRTALSPSGGDDAEWDEEVRRFLAKRKATVTGFAVGETDGAWLRIGYQHAEMTLVHGGTIRGHRVLGPGVRRARELLRANPAYDPDMVLREMSRELSNEIGDTIVDWQSDFPAVKVIWAHGPGAATGRLTNHLQADTKRRFDTPRISHIDCGEFPQAVAEVPTALHALSAPLLGTPQRTLRAPRHRRQLLRVLGGCLVAFAMMGSWAYSGRIGDDVAQRVSLAQSQQALIESQAQPELEALIGQAQSAQVLMDELADGGGPHWLAALQHFEGRPFQLTRTQTSDQATVACGSSEVVALLEDMDAVAEAIFGAGSYARAGASIACSPTGDATYQISMGAAGVGQ